MSSLRPSLRVAVTAAILSASTALAQTEEAAPVAPATPDAPMAPAAPASPQYPRLDIGASSGLNNPAGIYGLEADFRLLNYVSVGLAGGNAAWGLRFTPQARVYPFGIQRFGLFLEGGLSVNTGGLTYIEINGVRQEADMLVTPTANASLGYRQSMMSNRGWLAIRAGYGFSLRKDNVSVRGGGELNPLLQTAVDLSQPGGFMLGLSAGVAVF